MSREGFTLIELIVVITIIGAVILILGTQCSCGAFVSEDRVIRAIEDQGYTNVRLSNKSIFFYEFTGCSSSDSVSYDVSVINPLGKTVHLVACAGWPFKGVTIRGR